MPDGDRSAQLEALIRQFSKLVRSAAARVGGAQGRQIAEDVEQRVFLNLWKQLESEQNIANPASYLYRCAVRETIRLVSSLRSYASIDEGEAAGSLSSTRPPDEQAELREQGKVIAEVLRSLPIDRRRALQ